MKFSKLSSSKYITASAVFQALILTIPASAADLPRTSQPFFTQLAAPSVGTFYVRGDVGIARNNLRSVAQQDLTDNGGNFLSRSIGDSPNISLGVGYQFNQKFRADITAEYRASTAISALDNLTANIIGPDGILQANTAYNGRLGSVLGLVNGYFDIGTWRGITPYVGAGFGIARHTVSGLTTSSSSTFTDAFSGAISQQATTGYSASKSVTKFAWALMAGAAFDISKNAKLDLGYRYLNLGSNVAATSGIIDCVCGTQGSPIKLSGLSSHEIRVGIRWSLSDEPSAKPIRPVIAKY